MMKISSIRALTLVTLVLGWTTVIAADTPPHAGIPTAVFSSTRYNFPTVVDGVAVMHEFAVKNIGSADLKIEKVKTG